MKLDPKVVAANAECLECHAAKTMDPEPPMGWLGEIDGVRAEYFQKSKHGSFYCTDCHDGVWDYPHEDPLPAVNCGSCHSDEDFAYQKSIHGASHLIGNSEAATCWSCHGNHEILDVKNVSSPVNKFNMPRTCAKCHDNPGISEEYRIKYPEAASHYVESIHGRALLKMGLIVAPSCNDCHGVHDIKRSVDHSSKTNHQNIADTCGKCHVGIEKIYNESVHGKLLLEGKKDGPVCSDCHTAHDIEVPTNGHFKAASDERCGKCHEDRLEHYRDTYHGKAIKLGKPNVAPEVAACYDCHGHHDVFPVDDERSLLSSKNIVETCSKCHGDVNKGFTEYQPHANPMDRANYPKLHYVFLFMTSLLIGVFSFFGLHTLLWLIRSVYLYLNDTKTFRETKVASKKDDVEYTRFNPFERMLHLMVVTSFLLLVVTGMPLKFYYTDWAKIIFSIMGGPDVARTLHHFGAIITFTYFFLHLAGLVRGFWDRRATIRNPETGKTEFKRVVGAIFGPDSMVPTLQDWRDFVAHQKWFFGKGEKPQFDRWTYWERFDYFAVFWGIFIIGLSGLILWFPTFFTAFLPGWIINIAMIVHSDEALLAAGFIFTFHFFNTHFRIEKFPMDTVIFSGRISETEMLHERRRWYDRLKASGRLEKHKVTDDWEGRKVIAQTMGFLFFGFGLFLLGLIVYAMTIRLVH